MKAGKHAIGASIAILAASISAAWGSEYAVETKGCLTSEPMVIDKAGDVVIGTNDTRGVTDVSSTGPLNGKSTHECRVLWTATKAGVEFTNRCTNVSQSGDRTFTTASGTAKSFEWKYIAGTGKFAGISGGGTGSLDRPYPRSPKLSGACWAGKGSYSLP